MAIIEFKNKPNTDTPINDINLNHNFKELNKLGNCASFSKTNLQTLSQTTRETILFNNTDYVDEEYFELQSDGRIKVLKDISRVQANYSIRFENVKDHSMTVYCLSTEDAGFNNAFVVNNGVLTGSGVLKVKKGGFIFLDTYTSSNTAGVSGYDKAWCGVTLFVLK